MRQDRSMLWNHYVFRRGLDARDMWDSFFSERPIRLLYIAGRGFDIRAQAVLKAFMESIELNKREIQRAEMLLVGFSGYRLSKELREETNLNAQALEGMFSRIGSTSVVAMGVGTGDEDDISTSTALRNGTNEILARLEGYTDIVLDVSSLPRVVYLSLLTSILQKLIPDRNTPNAVVSGGVNFQVLVAEDAVLDSKIRSEDPSNELVLIPGFSSSLYAESVQHWPMVWFPMLGENRVSQLEKVMNSVISSRAEICPVLPHPSKDPRRADKLLVEFKRPLFDSRETPVSNILYVHESHPFEAYRQLLGAMQRYRESMRILGGCRLIVTPLASKLITLGAGLACFEMRTDEATDDYGVAIPYAEPTRYTALPEELHSSAPEIVTLLLTGEAYDGTRHVGATGY